MAIERLDEAREADLARLAQGPPLAPHLHRDGHEQREDERDGEEREMTSKFALGLLDLARVEPPAPAAPAPAPSATPSAAPSGTG